MQKRIHPDVLLKQKLKKEDAIVIPDDNDFYNNLHNKIMSAVEQTEVKKLSEWSKAWVFLEPGQNNMKASSKIHLIK